MAIDLLPVNFKLPEPMNLNKLTKADLIEMNRNQEEIIKGLESSLKTEIGLRCQAESDTISKIRRNCDTEILKTYREAFKIMLRTR